MLDKEIIILKRRIDKYNMLYYKEYFPEISDSEYDLLYQRLLKIEKFLSHKKKVQLRRLVLTH